MNIIHYHIKKELFFAERRPAICTRKNSMQAKFAYILAWHLLTYRKTRYNKQLESAMQACKQNVW